jgi:hypothetical protein
MIYAAFATPLLVTGAFMWLVWTMLRDARAERTELISRIQAPEAARMSAVREAVGHEDPLPDLQEEWSDIDYSLEPDMHILELDEVI